MVEHLYRYRDIDRLLSKSNELENQHIYFATPPQLNDPMEGFRDIFWVGDSVCWKNLFKHYLSCLQHVYTMGMIGGENYKLDKSMIPVREPRYDPVGKYSPIIDHTIRLFFSASGIQKLVDALSKRTIPLRTIELTTLLDSIHRWALLSIQKSLHQQKLGPLPTMTIDVEEPLRNMFESLDLINRFHSNNEIDEEMVQISDFVGQKTTMQLRLIHQYNNPEDSLSSNKNFIGIDFSSAYIERLEYLLYPPWYAACFMETASNSSAWGHYAGNHTGVCLKFKVNNTNNRSSLDLYGEIGSGPKGPTYGYRSHELRPVTYDVNHVSIDFFQSIGTVSISILNRDWHYFEGVASSGANNHAGSSDENRRRYWDEFSSSLCIKTIDWAYEKEHRIILDGFFHEYTTKEERLLKYRFSDLEGIIFGIRTAMSDKLEIMRIIDKKCQEEKRASFNFYQAYYSNKTKSIEYSELSLLKIKL